MTKYDTQQPYIASYMIFRNKDGKVAFLLRSNTDWMNGFYTLPSGKIEKDESFTAGAIRESREEVGVTIETADLKPVLSVHRHTETNWVDVYFEVTKWQGELQNAEPHVHGELAWFDPDDLPDNVIPNIPFAFQNIKAGNHYCEYDWE
jgi:8-oxo-dGTP pyrophosphatase MutT (NUDIX family)